MSDLLNEALSGAVRASGAPGAVACVADLDTVYCLAAAGSRQRKPVALPATTDTPYDLASLTKVIATTTAFMTLWEQGRVDLDQPVGEVVPVPAFNRFTFRHLITHTSGLPAGFPWYRDATSLTEMIQRAGTVTLRTSPGARREYSDIGFMILGKAVELLVGDTLDAHCRTRFWQPLGMEHTDYRPPAAWAGTCAATEECEWRGRLMVGEVHDENAFAAGGVSGHAGLFSTAPDLMRFCRALLSGKLLKRETLAMMIRLDHVPFYPWQGLAWKVDPWVCGSEGYLPSRRAFGHTGWTGTCVWMDLDRGLFSILLSNTCHPSRRGRDNPTLRRVFHDAIARQCYPKSSNTHTGLDRIVWDGFEPISGKRLALLTHRPAISEVGTGILDVLKLYPGANLRRIYSPEHGFLASAEAGQTVKGQQGAVPIVSLYGEKKRPDPAELADVDLFLVDLQDIGARYYTYAHTMKECLAACAQAGVPVMVLDRPNPLGSDVLEGPVAAESGSPVCWAPVPVRHGMTLGELAMYFRDTQIKEGKLNLTVQPLDSWLPARLHHECALPWLPPSPNIPRPETALLYVGMCLFEGTNLNEGRGTDTAFHLIGAPWLDPLRVLDALDPAETAGCALRPNFYTPQAIPGKAADPRFKGVRCNGIRVMPTDFARVRPFTLALALLSAIRKCHPNDFAWGPFFDTLAGGPTLRRQLEDGLRPSEIVAAAAPGIEAYRAKRPRLYA